MRPDSFISVKINSLSLNIPNVNMPSWQHSALTNSHPTNECSLKYTYLFPKVPSHIPCTPFIPEPITKLTLNGPATILNYNLQIVRFSPIRFNHAVSGDSSIRNMATRSWRRWAVLLMLQLILCCGGIGYHWEYKCCMRVRTHVEHYNNIGRNSMERLVSV